MNLDGCRQEAVIIDGKKIAEEIQEELKVVVDSCINVGKKRPKLVAILVGNHPSSKAYIGRKMKAAKSIGNYIFILNKQVVFITKLVLILFVIARNRELYHSFGREYNSNRAS